MDKLFRGTYTAIITPFNEQNEIDWDDFEKLVEKQIESGVEGIVFVGTTGESPTLSHEEHKEILRWSVKTINGRCQVIHGTGSNNTRESIELAMVAADAGADGHLVINPYYNKPTPEGLYRHFTAIADAVDLPIIIYNIKGRTAINLETDNLLRLAAHKNIVGVKEASGDIHQMMDVMRRTADDFCVLVGDDALTLPFMACGGDGLISVVSNCLPHTTSEMVRDCLNGEWDKARSSYYRILDIMNLSMKETNPIPIKAIMHHLGYCNPKIRLPLCEPTEATMKEIEKHIKLINELG
ncbi:4-hydroxy-tetrahydrodipicolinate synthase [Catalinimonas alkaloidigena]|uniref:4-hydroxy-tetrahydrodipicolinate synthase n=1 Tax=Catalinimonas alkaloidigena TaxID=1075417 RepID=UPI002406498E|nr:4-hydroxy-tetrahydrodipicolinate synthase [Catalinimonas alkaloidigena]MDF9799848.1 4-hydroxy-tetrahydrodipicolinate synthase [Catalinimonas alkaloidigena]